MAEAAPIYRCTICHAVYSAGERFCPLDAGTITAEGDTDPRVGKTIDGRYFIRRLIGRGGMGAVYEADHVGLDKRVAVKFLAINKTDRDALARFRREAKIASKIVHEHVVQIYDVGTADADTDFIVMEYLEGRDLAAVLKDFGSMDGDRVVSIARKVLRGLRAIHQAGIVHRDIKPANILLSPRDDDRDFVKIMDFGISRQIHGDTITNTGAIIGTPEYMSPEQLLADNIDQRADLYAVGIMMYRMVTGKLPFTGMTGGNATFDRSAAANPYVPVPALDAIVGKPIADAIAKATMKDADERFADAQAFLAALEGIAVTARPVKNPIVGTEETQLPLAVAQTEIAQSEAPRSSGLARPSVVTAPAKRTDPRVPVMHAFGSPSQLLQGSIAPTLVTRSRTGLWVMLGLLIAGAAITIAIIVTRNGDSDRVALQPSPPAPPAPPSLPAGGPQQPTASPSNADQQKGLVAKARASEAAGNLAQAVEEYAAAYALEPTAEIAFHLGEINEKLGNKVEASQAFQRYLHLAKDASDKDLVIARIAKLEKAAGSAPANPATPPPATGAKPATGWKVNHGETNDGLEECHCLPTNGPDTMSLCAELGPSLCNCRHEGNTAMCSVAPMPCQANEGKCNSSGFECSDGVFDKLHIKGKMDDACHGFVMWEADHPSDGKLFCDVCANQKLNRLFRGHHGEPCTGYYRHTGQKLEGRLWCKYP